MKKKAISFLEIIIAAAVMAIAMIPIFGMLSRQTVETDKNASQAFAINKATEILNTLLDYVPFATIREGNPGYLKAKDLPSRKSDDQDLDSLVKDMASMLFGSEKEGTNGYPCKGIIKDSRGINYLVYMRVEDVVSTIKYEGKKPKLLPIGSDYPKEDANPNEFAEESDIFFAYLKNPSLLTSNKWIEDYAETPDERNKPLTEIDIPGKGVAEFPKNIYLDEGIGSIKGTKYGFFNPTAARYTAKMVLDQVPYKVDEKFAWCPFKRLIVQIQWNIDPSYFSDPESTKGNVQRIHLMAIKGDI